LYEDHDFASNVLKEYRVTIGSLKLDDTNLPADQNSWITFLSGKVNSIIKELFKKDDPMIPVLTGVVVRSTRLNSEFSNFDAIFKIQHSR